jgi:hypothetical protein
LGLPVRIESVVDDTLTWAFSAAISPVDVAACHQEAANWFRLRCVWVIVYGVITEEVRMAKPNYQFEKRQRELEKERKKEAKAKKKSPPPQPAPLTEGNVVPEQK